MLEACNQTSECCRLAFRMDGSCMVYQNSVIGLEVINSFGSFTNEFQSLCSIHTKEIYSELVFGIFKFEFDSRRMACEVTIGTVDR